MLLKAQQRCLSGSDEALQMLQTLYSINLVTAIIHCIYASTCSRSRLIVLLTVTEEPVLQKQRHSGQYSGCQPKA